MRNLKLVIQYDGTNYHGWQVQPGLLTVQGVLVESIEKILRERVKIYAAARTDSGVHARWQVVSFKSSSKILPKRLKLALNRILPRDIAVCRASYVSRDFNARYSAKSRLYRYTLLNGKVRSPFHLNYCYFSPHQVDFSSMETAAQLFAGRHDFSFFQSSSGRKENTVREVKMVKVFRRKGFIYFDIMADGFLTHMVRRIMGALLEVGRGKISHGEVKKMLEGNSGVKGRRTLPSSGLCLMKVTY